MRKRSLLSEHSSYMFGRAHNRLSTSGLQTAAGARLISLIRQYILSMYGSLDIREPRYSRFRPYP